MIKLNAMRYTLYAILLVLLLCSSSCGGSSSDDYSSDVPSGTSPYIQSVNPSAGSAGDQITIKGVGFSSAAPNDIIIIGEEILLADSYSLLDPPEDVAVEAIVFTLPAGLSAGVNELIVLIHDNVSNVVDFTVQ